MNGYGKYLAGAAALAAVGFLLAVGLMSVIFSAKTGAFAPSTSADAASWVQAIGSIAAILSAYHLGARQTAEARRREAVRAFERAARQEAILVLIETTCDRVMQTAEIIVRNEPGIKWEILLPIAISETTTGMDTLRGIPHAEFDPPESVRHLTEIRASLDKLLMEQRGCDEYIKRNLRDIQVGFSDDEEVKSRCIDLRKHTTFIASIIKAERAGLRAAFARRTA